MNRNVQYFFCNDFKKMLPDCNNNYPNMINLYNIEK